MTRVNLVPPSELSRLHLIAEYHEIPRIFGLVRKAIERGEKPDDKRNPKEYVLGPGHCRFFYPLLGWLRHRQTSLIFEMNMRGYKPLYDADDLDGISIDWQGWYTPTEEAIALNRARIKERS